jgi:signal transduction histidine kinase
MAVQAAGIAVVAILGIGIASIVIEQVMVRQALTNEAVHFWSHYDKDPTFSLPNTDNLKGYFSVTEQESEIPEEFRGYYLGFNELPKRLAHSLLYITEQDGARLYLLFDGKSVGRLAIYFGILPLTIVLVLIYVSAWFFYRQSSHLLSPIVWLADKFDKHDPANPKSQQIDISEIPGDVDWEVEKLANSIDAYSRRIKRFVDRERAFTRDASHEFRTPLTVIKMASGMLQTEKGLSEKGERYLEKIVTSTEHLRELVKVFLMLARESDDYPEDELVSVLEVVEQELEDVRIVNDNDKVVAQVDQSNDLELNVPRNVLAITVGNLIRNAFQYTHEGSVSIRVTGRMLEIKDTGVGMGKEDLEQVFQAFYRGKRAGADSDDKAGESSAGRKPNGYGVGLAIVHRLATQFGWTVEFDSELGEGTTVTVQFPER